MEKELHLMLDIETWGLRPGQAIRSIALVPFHIQPTTIDTPIFYYNTLDDRSRDPAIVAWWSRQSPEAQERLFTPAPVHLPEVLQHLIDYYAINAIPHTTPVWSKGPSFDAAHMDEAFQHYGLTPPWHYRAHRCVRTIAALAPQVPKNVGGTSHYAVDDCLSQIADVQAAYRGL